MDWIRSGKAFIGIHSASDTFHKWPEFIEMLGGEFKSHGAQVGVELLSVDTANPATRHLPPVFALTLEEIYLFKNYNAGRVNELLVLDKHPNERPGAIRWRGRGITEKAASSIPRSAIAKTFGTLIRF